LAKTTGSRAMKTVNRAKRVNGKAGITGLKAKPIALAVALTLGAIGFQPNALASSASGGATEMTQIVNMGELIAIYGKEAAAYTRQGLQYANELKMYLDMVQNTLSLPQQIWGNITEDLSGLASVVRKGQALAYSMSNLDTEFKNRFKNYGEFLKKEYTGVNFSADYKSWNQTQSDGILGALSAANLQADQFATEESTLKQLQVMSKSAVGRKQALQVGAQIAMQQVQHHTERSTSWLQQFQSQ